MALAREEEEEADCQEEGERSRRYEKVVKLWHPVLYCTWSGGRPGKKIGLMPLIKKDFRSWEGEK